MVSASRLKQQINKALEFYATTVGEEARTQMWKLLKSLFKSLRQKNKNIDG